MANTFKNASIVVNTTPGTVIYTTPSATSSVVHTLIIANTSAQPQNVTVQMVDVSTSTSFRLLTNAPIPVGGSLFFPKPINLEAGDAIRITASTSASLEAYASILEITP
jgi:hypothetical protein